MVGCEDRLGSIEGRRTALEQIERLCLAVLARRRRLDKEEEGRRVGRRWLVEPEEGERKSGGGGGDAREQRSRARETSLSGNQTITSRGGRFVLGFFTPPGSGGNYYIGIWYGEISVLTPAWVANRVTPITDQTTSELKISDDGNLVLLNQFKSVIWSTNVTTIPSSDSTVVAVILDNGNLQLRDGSNSSLVFWQSFDHPTDTWLPGAKLGFNKITKRSQHLTSWKNKVDPSPGIFTFEMDPTGLSQYLILWNMSRIYWASVLWDGHLSSLVPVGFMYHMQVVNDTDEMYITFTADVANHSMYRVVLDNDTGQIQVQVWIENSK
ncbi:G-type lectin S-receptor-like serine/threonine-protein kinase At2g19130 [Zingiber officinale]|uniref:G-type lectin S-receptor-like serine/threonine-protein kinase At2g19130 n=1 Tax=Zingiber officinale TaxID=94328 RepID=UPI001C4C20E1|nr:G-type lectin S-receptor-like serine/threonine-protein kinase At2g19130 [Zingiber officinale]